MGSKRYLKSSVGILSAYVVKYIGRYLGRPVIATSRIDSYDEDSETITFHCNRHEDDKYIQKTIPALDFIKRLIRQFPKQNGMSSMGIRRLSMEELLDMDYFSE